MDELDDSHRRSGMKQAQDKAVAGVTNGKMWGGAFKGLQGDLGTEVERRTATALRVS